MVANKKNTRFANNKRNKEIGEEEDTIEKILRAITTLCTKVDSMDNEIQKLKTNEDNLKSKASQQHDYKNAEIRQSEDGKNPELKGDDGKLLKTHNVCLNTAAGTSQRELSGIPELHKAFITYKSVTKGNLFYVKFYTATIEILYEEIKPPIQVVKIGLTKDMIIPEDIGHQSEIQKIEIPSFYANKRIIGISTIIQELANNYLNGNAIWSYYARDQLMIYSNSRELRKSNMDEVQRWILSLLKPKERPTTRALKEGFISAELLMRYCKLIVDFGQPSWKACFRMKIRAARLAGRSILIAVVESAQNDLGCGTHFSSMRAPNGNFAFTVESEISFPIRFHIRQTSREFRGNLAVISEAREASFEWGSIWRPLGGKDPAVSWSSVIGFRVGYGFLVRLSMLRHLFIDLLEYGGVRVSSMLNFYNSCLRPYFGKVLGYDSMSLDIIEYPYLTDIADLSLIVGNSAYDLVPIMPCFSIGYKYPVKVRGLAYSLLDTSSAIWGI
ncbi:hypothetical protein H5410_031132 [Solanum commersonii]|uniref:Uncharacterized protein n=1 Tax=Solanum commersonii TaxID=4109 RepID=A0A9J5YHJ1_SOLCO|nr:hypothetical protein H5410_031132 [Solanum commersonii]